MNKLNCLERRKKAELSHALLASCPRVRGQHEEQARAYAKIIDVLGREVQEALTYQRS